MAKKKRKTTKAWAVVDRETREVHHVWMSRSMARSVRDIKSANPRNTKVSRVTITVED